MTLVQRSSWRKRAPAFLQLYGTHVEALVLLAASRFAVRFGFKYIASWALTGRRPDEPRPGRGLELSLERSVEGAVRFFRWRNCCLAAALTVKLMLARRGYRSTIHLGAGFKDTGDLYAHAWIDAGGRIITGERHARAVTPLPR